MGIYIFLIVFTLFLDFLHRNNRIKSKSVDTIFLIVCIIFTMVSALRFNVGTDYKGTYTKAFGWLRNGLHYDYEFLFLKLNYLVIRFNGEVQHLMALCSLITIPAFFVLIKKNVDKKYWFLSAFLFIGTTVYYASMNVVRQYLAIAIVLYSYPLLKNGKYMKFFLINVLASFIHTSVVFNIVLGILFLIFKKAVKTKSQSFIIVVYVISLIGIFVDFRDIFNLFSFIVPDRYLVYINSVFIREKNISAVLKLILPNLLLWLSINYKKELTQNNETLYPYYAVFIYTIISNMFFGINVFIRLTWYCDLFVMIFIPQILKIMCDRPKDKYGKKSFYNKYNTFCMMLIIYYIVLNIWSIFISGGHGVVPYQTFLNK